MTSFRAVAASTLPVFMACSVPSAAAPDAPVTANMGPVRGEGQLVDNSGALMGNWTIDATLSEGIFSGTATITVKGATYTGPLTKASYLENGHCYFKFESGRSTADIGGDCTTTRVGGIARGFTPLGEVYGWTGKMSGRLAFAQMDIAQRAAPAAAASGTIPTATLKCTRIEWIGGVVAGDTPRYEWHPSAMVTLTLTPGGTYRTGNRTSGNFVRDGKLIRFTSGFYQGAVGTLQDDSSGKPAIYFNREDNYRPDGTFRIDSGRTSCVVPR
jgi:hypothetical protein